MAALMAGSVLLGGGCSWGCGVSSSGPQFSIRPPRRPGKPPRRRPRPGPRPAVRRRRSSSGGQGGTGTTVRLAPASQHHLHRQLTVRAADVGSAAAQAAQIAQGRGGYVSSETTSANPDHPSEATASVQLKIPVASYVTTLGQLAGQLGRQVSLHQRAQDVTQQVADVTSQVTSAEAAIAQLRTLLSHAGTVGDLLSVQNQINTEEANLESMQAQQRALSRETSYATVTLILLGPRARPPAHRPKAPPTLAGGFGTGWHALRTAVSWTLAFLGAIAPFAAVLAVAGFAIYHARRWLTRRSPPAEPASPGS